ncbi:hypothetical protein U9M48_043530 [Paspalum notatum var. saurae]|uniref:Reverse transcriptase domain-containing protein n=1 Tax=Paspalum notatum var. saurae TaxID=547442 RepID=A0AAQ3UX32_PASNO
MDCAGCCTARHKLLPNRYECKHPPSQSFRPISLCNVIYKIITSTLAKRIKNHLPSYIHQSQAAFIPEIGRHITTNIEISHSFSLKNWNQQTFMLKIDLAKAFDRIKWSFISRAPTRRGFSDHFCRLVHQCISTPSFYVIINEQPYCDFSSQRAIRQGCPLSPNLFVLAINELSISLQEAMQNEKIKGITLGYNYPSIHSLMLADDLIICGQTTQEEITKYKQYSTILLSSLGSNAKLEQIFNHLQQKGNKPAKEHGP